MKSWFLFVFLVLTSSSVPNGESQQTDGPGGTKGLGSAPTMAPHHETQNESQSSTAAPISALPPTPTPPPTPSPTPPPLAPPPPPQNQTSQNSTDLDVAMETANATEDGNAMAVTPENAVATATTATPVTTATPITTATAVSMTTAIMTKTTDDGIDYAAAPVPEKASNKYWGYVMLVFIIIAIIILCTVLFYLRRASGTYSFDLQRHVATNHLDQPAGTFELVYLDDLASKDQTPSEDLHPPASNGSVLLEDPGTDGEKDAPPEAPGANGLEAPPTRKSSDTTLSDAADTPSPSGSTTLFFSTVGEEHNENNNNPAVSSRDPFVEINLDEPAWCHQLLASPPPSSSVLPFSPFSFSSSSSSSSEHLQ